MKIAILSQDPSLYSTTRLKEAGEERGHQMRVVPYLRCYMN
ncbi:MAG: 30S ribosomal protein S6--L-glutamate ligase, partial [Xenococcaceae cyanobacterium MO_167.B52]|nr:30S ribosomal protein S6--L-glutamate ligase [Xenococcaceae cyanobacterium MO_167.B52]